jgi:S-methylmethionine-dependent homocysteine/selenocysteine methylase
MLNPLAPFLEKHNVVILDGALATELERRGADLRDPLWSAKLLLDNPALIRQVHHDYYAAGADVATTASYQATIPGLMLRGLDRAQAEDVLRLSVMLARQARDEFWGIEANRASAAMGPRCTMARNTAATTACRCSNSSPGIGRACRFWRTPAPIFSPARRCRASRKGRRW